MHNVHVLTINIITLRMVPRFRHVAVDICHKWCITECIFWMIYRFEDDNFSLCYLLYIEYITSTVLGNAYVLTLHYCKAHTADTHSGMLTGQGVATVSHHRHIDRTPT